LAVTYTGNHSFDQPLSNTDANASVSANNTFYPNGFGGLPTATPDPRFLKITQILTQGYTNYDALSVQIRHSFSYGFQGQVGWTWAHDLGDTTVYNPYNLAFGYGNASIDVRNAVVSDLVWQEPHKFANKFTNAVLGGWNFGAKLFIYGGRPTSSSDSKIASQINSNGTVGTTFLATALQPLKQVCGVVTGSGNPPCYTQSEFETYGTASKIGTPIQTNFGETGPGVFRGPGYFDLDTQISKKFFLREKMNLELGAQFYNTFNHPNFSTPSVAVTSGGIGLITGDLAPPTSIYGSGQGAIVTGRVMVVSGKFNF
jgi:hypothetical protein